MLKNIKKSLELIEKYLFNNHKYGFWIDFDSHNGSTCWTTSYVARNLANNSKNLEKLLIVKNRIQFNQRSDGGWAYNHTVASDTDTTTNCLLFLFKFSSRDSKIINKGIEYILKHQDKQGGFFTYSEEEFKQIYGNKDGKGWYSPNVEVTSLAIKVLIENKSNSAEIKKALDFIKSKQNNNGSWDPYWWSSEEYAIINSINVLEKYPEYDENVKKALIYLTDKRKEYGWINDFTKIYSSFYAALALELIIDQRLIRKYKIAKRYQIADVSINSILENEINKLIYAQNRDGSYNPEPILRIPRSDITDISTVKKWLIDIPHKNTIYRDNNKFFTTATVYPTLLKYLETIPDDKQ
jgi:squalene cyclase